MIIKDKLIYLSFIVAIIMVFYTVYNINKFMKVEQTCEDDFAIINKCLCIPDGSNYSFAKDLTKNRETSELNFTYPNP